MSGHPSILFLAGHCPLTGRYFKPCIGVERVVLCIHKVCDILVDLRLNAQKQSSIQDLVDKLSNTID